MNKLQIKFEKISAKIAKLTTKSKSKTRNTKITEA